MIKKQHGVTLIELMISLVLGLALIAGIGQLFIQSQKSFRLQRNVSDMTDDATFALTDLAKGVLLAGYAEDGQTTSFIADTSVLSSGINFNAGEFIKGTDNTLIYRFKLDSSQSQENNSICIVDSYNPNDIVPVYVNYQSSDNSLSCKSKTATLPMIVDVEKLEFQYGIRVKTYSAIDSTKRTPENDTFYYVKSANVTDWKSVFAVKAFLVMRSADDNIVRVQTGYKIDGVQQTPVPSDKRLYKTFTKTIYLRAADNS
jgi:type IV pilus assembly protein PilW